MKLAMAVSTVLLALSANGGAAPLLDLPQYPQIDQQALERHAALTVERRESKARAAGDLSCARYCEMLERIYTRVTHAAREQGGAAQAIRWRMLVTTTRGEAAMSLPGGYIVISEDLIASLGLTEAEVAFILAHEVAHVLLQHEAECLDYLQATLLPHGVRRTVRDLYAEMDYDAGALLRMESVMQRGEMEADYAGMLLGAQAGYAPAQMAGALAKIDAGSARGSGIVRTHPAMLQRLQHLESVLPTAERVAAVAMRHRESGKSE